MNNSNTSSAQQLHPAEIEILSYTNENPSSQNTGKLLSDIAHNVEAADFQSLAFRYLGEELTTASGDPRLPTQKEAAVIIAEHFKDTLEKKSHGVAILNGNLHLYGRDHWVEVSEHQAQRALGEFAESIGHKVQDARFYGMREMFFKQIMTVAPLIERPPDKTIVNFGNGTLVIESQSEHLSPHDKEDAFTYVLPFQYDPDAQAPLFQNYLNRVLPDAECQTVMAEFFGWIFLRDLKLEKMLMLYGYGHNGKSVIFDILNALLGEENISHIGMDSLKTPESRLPIVGKLLNYGSEVSGKVDPDIIKRAASGEAMEFRKRYGDPFTTDSYSRLAFNANNLPPDVEHTDGYFRRFLIIPFEEKITEEEKDPDLANKIITTELPGVMNWILTGMKRLRHARKFSPCPKSDACLNVYRHESDTVAQFLDEESYVPCLESRISKQELFGRYREYCHLNGYKSLGKRKFNERLSSHHRFQGGKHGDIGYFWNLKQIS